MQQSLCVGDAAPAKLASLFKCEIVGRFRILSVFLLTMENKTKIKKASLVCQSVGYKIVLSGNEEGERKRGGAEQRVGEA